MSTALFIGRFQPFHNAHLAVIKDILTKYDNVVILIGSTNEQGTKENPFSLKQRKEMINAALKGAGIKHYSLTHIADMPNDKQWVAAVEKNVKQFDAIYSGNPWTLRCFKKYGRKVKRIKLIKGISSTIVRNRMQQGKEWRDLVPKEAYRYIRQTRNHL